MVSMVPSNSRILGFYAVTVCYDVIYVAGFILKNTMKVFQPIFIQYFC